MAAALACAPLAWAPVSAHAQRSTDTLRVLWRDSVTRLDPYENQSQAAFVLAHEVWDTLVYRDPASFQIRPLLATAWRWEDDQTLLFTLRRSVLWHDGAPFTATDVADTIKMILSDPRLASSPLYNWLAGAEVVDATHVRVKLSRVTPAALEYFALVVWILPESYRARLSPDAFGHAPIGTGPYRVTHIDGNGVVKLERFDKYYPGSPKGMPAIRNITIRSAPDETSEIAALLSGETDWIWRFDPARLPAIRGDENLIGLQAGTMRVGYLSLDAAGRTGAGNPMTQKKVREAVAAAINRVALAHEIEGPDAEPLTTPCFPTQFGCETSAAVPIPYDPARARRLLAEAGYPHGFSVQLTTYEPPSWSAPIQAYLRAVGIEADVIQLPRGEVVLRAIQGETRSAAGDWGSYALNDVSGILPHFFTFTPEDYTRDPRVRDLILDAGRTRDAAQRKADYAQAIHEITANADWLPLSTLTVTYGFTKELEFQPCLDELPRFYLAKWRRAAASN
jgi:peptide/nickel transport system substrate-binding protein